MTESRRLFHCTFHPHTLAVVLAAALLVLGVAADVSDFAGGDQAGGDQAPGQQALTAQHAAQLRGLNTGFAKLLLKWNHTGTLEGVDLDTNNSSAEHTPVATAGQYLKSLVQKLHREVAHNVVGRMRYEDVRETYSYDQEDEHQQLRLSQADNEAEAEARYQHQHHQSLHLQDPNPYEEEAPRDHDTAEHELHGGNYEKHITGDRPDYMNEEAAREGWQAEPGPRPEYDDEAGGPDRDTSARDTPYERHDSHDASDYADYDPSHAHYPHSPEPRHPSSVHSSRPAHALVCLHEAGRGDCMAEEASHPLATKTVSYTSTLTSCSAEEAAKHKKKGTIVTVAAKDKSKAVSVSDCTWKVTYLRDAEAVAPSITKIGYGVALCRVADDEVCGAGSCDGITFKAKVGVYRTFAISEHEPTVGITDDTCKLPLRTARYHRSVAAANVNGMPSNSVNIASRPDRQRLHDALLTRALYPRLYGGQAIVLTGPLAAVNTDAESSADEQSPEYSYGMLEYVASFDGRRLTALETVKLAEDVPLVLPNTYKVLLENDH